MKDYRKTYHDAVKDTIESLKNNHPIPTGSGAVLPTPWQGFNRLLGGIGKDELVILAGPTGMGSSTVLINLFYHYLINETLYAVAFFTTMPYQEVIKRLLALHTGIPVDRLRSDFLKSPQEQEKVSDAIKLFSDSGSIIVSDHMIRLDDMYEVLEEEKPSLVLIDGFHDLDMGGPLKIYDVERQEQLRQDILGYALFSLKQDIPTAYVVSYRVPDAEEYSRFEFLDKPRPSYLRQIRGLVEEADLLVYLYRAEFYVKEEQRGVMQLHLRHRLRTEGSIDLIYYPDTGRLVNNEVIPLFDIDKK